MESQVIEMDRVEHRTRHDWDDETEITTTLLEVLEEAVGREALMEYPPLYECVDPDAIDGLFSPVRGTDRTGVVLHFEFAEHQVAIRGSGEIVVLTD